MFIYVGGVPGVGKTTVVKNAVELAKRYNLSLQEVNEKKLLCQITDVSSPKEYAQLSQEIRAKARRQMVAQLYELDKKDLATIRIRDDHFAAPKEDGSYWIRPLEPADKIHMLGFAIVVSAFKARGSLILIIIS